MWNDYKGSIDKRVIWTCKILCDWLAGPGRTRKNERLIREQADRLCDMSDDEKLQWISNLLPELEEELSIESGTPIHQIAETMRSALDNNPVYHAPIRRWFAQTVQYEPLCRTWTSRRIFLEMQRQQDCIGNSSTTRSKDQKAAATEAEQHTKGRRYNVTFTESASAKC